MERDREGEGKELGEGGREAEKERMRKGMHGKDEGRNGRRGKEGIDKG